MTNMKTNKYAKILSIISLVITTIYFVTPIFAFWNYKLSMIPFGIISIMGLLTIIIKKDNRNVKKFGAVVITVLAVIAVCVGQMFQVVVIAILAILIAWILFRTNFDKALMITVMPFTFIIQIPEIITYFKNSNEILLGQRPEIPMEVASSLYSAAINDIGMLIVNLGIVLLLIAIMIDAKNTNE